MNYENYEITSDNENNFVIKKHYINKKGILSEKVLSYHSKLYYAVEEMINILSIKKWDNEIREMKDVLKLIEEIRQNVHW